MTNIPSAQIYRVFSECYNPDAVGFDEIFLRDRRRRVTQVRKLVWCRLHERGWSSMAIGRAFHRDHATVLAGIFGKALPTRICRVSPTCVSAPTHRRRRICPVCCDLPHRVRGLKCSACGRIREA